MADKRGPKGPRNKVRQVVLVDGHPNCIFETKPRTVITIKHGSTVIKMGSIGPKKIAGLKGIPGIEVIEELKPHKRARKLSSVIAVKTTKTSTQLTVAAIDKGALDKAVENLANYLSENGINIHERCQWVCSLDKGKPAETVQPEPPPVHASTPSVQPDPSSVQKRESISQIQPAEDTEPTVKDRIMNYMKNKSSFSVSEISDVLAIPEKTVRDVLIDLKFVIPGTRKSRITKAVRTVQKGRYGTVMEIAHAPG